MSTTAIDESTNFLAHYGIKGMKWGRRKSQASASDTQTSQPKSNKKKLVKGLAATGAVVAGAVAARRIMQNSGSRRLDIAGSYTGPSGVPHVMLGKNFIKDHMARISINEQNVRTVRNVRRSVGK